MRTDIKFTYKEYAALPETGPRYQLIEGELEMSPSPNFRHQDIVGNIYAELRAFVRKRRLGKVCVSPVDVILDDDNVFQPDVLFISASRKHIIAPEGVRGAPDLCVEILSPSNRNLDLETKRVVYARHGVIEYWIVDPENDSVTIYRLQENPRAPLRVLKNSETLSSDLMPGFTMDVAAVFAE